MSELRISTDKGNWTFPRSTGSCRPRAYWSLGIPAETVARAIAGSLCFGGYVEGVGQVAFARVVSDFATFGYLADVFVLPAQRGQGYSKQLLDAVFAHPQLQGLRRFMLATWDAHDLYARYGFTAPARPDRLMEISRPDLYSTTPSA